MSRFSGKCDFYDHIEIWGAERTLKAKIYIRQDNENVLLNFKEYKDMIPYFPHIISSCCCSKTQGDVIYLTDFSWVDHEEQHLLDSYLQDLFKYYRSCKRKKVPYDIETAVQKTWTFCHKDIVRILAERVKESGLKAKTDGLELPMSKIYRQELREELDKYST